LADRGVYVTALPVGGSRHLPHGSLCYLLPLAIDRRGLFPSQFHLFVFSEAEEAALLPDVESLKFLQHVPLLDMPFPSSREDGSHIAVHIVFFTVAGPYLSC
jgi:hypothetical protein